MGKSHLMLLSIAMLASAVTGIAQNDDITVDSKVSPNQIKAWLEGNDYRLIAWGAHFASKSDDADNDAVYVEIMAAKMARWIPPSRTNYIPNSDDSARIMRSAMSEILYSLIEKNERVPVGSLTPIVSDYPTQTLILAARLPAEDATPFLQNWYEKQRQLYEKGSQLQTPATAFAFIAAMLLAKAPPPGLAASVLAESGERLSFWVADGMWQKSKWTGGPPPVCKDADQVFDPPPQDREELSKWPPQFQYQFQGDSSPYGGTRLVDVGGKRISYRRISILTIPSPCYFPDVVSDEARHHLVAELLGVDDKEMPWPVHQDVICILECKEGFLTALRNQIDVEESKLIATAEALRAKGYLTQSEANAARPKLSVIVNDAREAAFFDGQDHLPQSLPRLVPADARTSIKYDKR